MRGKREDAKMNPAERGKLKDECDEVDRLYEATMANQWEKVVDIMQNTQIDHATKLTKWSDTALHVAISSYDPKTRTQEKSLAKMIGVMKDKRTLRRVLDTKNHFGDTPLHVAAAIGWLGIFDTVIQETYLHPLLENRNSKGETPFFIAAHHAHLNIFLRLYDKFKPGGSSAKRKDGNTILHRAIFQENFELAYVIVECYPNTVMLINKVGESPLHILAKKPNVFKSSSHLRFSDSIIYYCVYVDKLRSINEIPRDPPPPDRSTSESGNGPDYPENHTTCVKIFVFLCSPILKIRDGIVAIFTNRPSSGTDVENHYHQNHEPRTKGKKGYRGYHDLFPDNYVTCIDLFKFAMKIILVILGVGFGGIREIENKKKMYLNALEVLDKMLVRDSSYKYDNGGQQPEIDEEEDSGNFAPPKEEPQFDFDGNYLQDTKATTTGIQEDEKSESVIGDTPLIVAAKIGILEMVKKILTKFPGGIQDRDSQGRNVLMVAAENRQISVFDFLMQIPLPNYFFHHVDNYGNSILHLAAKLGEKQPWRIPGAALQMQWEILWYKHVKRSIPSLCFTGLNAKDESPLKIFSQTHEHLVKSGNEWMIKTSESCTVVAALIATVAFATSATVPGGLDQQHGYPVLKDYKAFDIFSVASPIALCLSITALFYFVTIISWRFEESDFEQELPRKLFMGLTCLFSGIAAMFVSFVAGHTFVLTERLRTAAVPIYAAAMIPVMFFVMGQLPMYRDLVWAASIKVPLRSYKVFHDQ